MLIVCSLPLVQYILRMEDCEDWWLLIDCNSVVIVLEA